MKKILILIQSPFLKKDYDRLGIDILKKNFDVKVLDFSSWLRPSLHHNYKDKIFYCEEYNKITNRDIRRICRKYFDFSKLNIAIMGKYSNEEIKEFINNYSFN